MLPQLLFPDPKTPNARCASGRTASWHRRFWRAGVSEGQDERLRVLRRGSIVCRREQRTIEPGRMSSSEISNWSSGTAGPRSPRQPNASILQQMVRKGLTRSLVEPNANAARSQPKARNVFDRRHWQRRGSCSCYCLATSMVFVVAPRPPVSNNCRPRVRGRIRSVAPVAGFAPPQQLL